MNSNLIYHVSEVVQKKDSYLEFDSLDFDINVGEGRSLVKNSVRLLGDLDVLDGGGANSAEIYFDPICGVHAFIDSVQVTFTDGANVGVKENIQNYARYVAMSEMATKAPEDALNGSSVCELKGFDHKTSKLYANGRITRNSGAKPTGNQDFSMKPVCALNKMSGGNLSYSKSGQIRLTMNLAQNRSALMGSDLDNNADTYAIINPRVIYQSVLSEPKEQDTIMRPIYNVKNTIQSNFASISARVPAVCDSVTMSAQLQSAENTAPFSNYECNMPKGLEELQFLFNDSTNEYISYSITDLTEMLQRGINSILDNGHNMVSGNRFSDNKNFITGLGFNGYVDLSNQKFSVQIKSGADNANAYNIYLYFHSIMSL
jgi:hypothetical protein